MGKDSELLEYQGYRFLLVHDPEDVSSFDGWIVHGHVHNNELEKYPFINGEGRTINVSVEVINYKPVSLDWIISLGPQKVKRIETVLDTQPGSIHLFKNVSSKILEKPKRNSRTNREARKYTI